MKIGKLFESLIKENSFYHGSPYNFDHFDMSKLGSGDGRQKYGYGLYFTDSINTATNYAKDLTLGKDSDGLNVYEVRLLDLPSYVKWDEGADNVIDCVIRLLDKLGLDDDAETLRNETSQENGYDMWSFGDLYEWLTYVLDGPENTTRYLYKHCNISGIIAYNAWLEGMIYVAFSDDLIKIIDKEKVKV